MSPINSRSATSRLTPPSTKIATSRPLWRNWRAVLGMAMLLLAGQQPPQVHADDFAAIPGAGERGVGGRGAFGGCGRGRSDRRGIERTSFERPFGGLCANLDRR